ncbi:MAG: DNA replication/repair protein RecF [Acidobacteria bacterium]|nr:DNA replication/repair protein RecF [Acidobacteriota bacterium]
MHLVTLQLDRFRNFTSDTVSFSPATNLIFGLNGQGKTNLLEAIYILGHGKSYRTSSVKECIRFGHEACSVAGAVRHAGGERRMQVTLSPFEKKLILFGRDVSLEEFLGQFHVVAFTQSHLAVVRGSPGDRRAFLDRGMVTLYPGHLRALMNYQRALRQRNRLLADTAAGSKTSTGTELVESWEQSLAREGASVVWNRLRYVEELRREIPKGVFSNESVSLHYVSTVKGDFDSAETVETNFVQALKQRRAADNRLGFTSIGPHRDELKITVGGRAAGAFGSAGQQRSALLSLYFAQMEIHKKVHGFYPVFLVDDVEAELDDERLRIFLGYLGERTQTFLTTAKRAVLESFSSVEGRFIVDSGRIFKASEDCWETARPGSLDRPRSISPKISFN